MVINIDMSAEEVLLSAERFLDERDLVGFVADINMAMLLTRGQEDLFARATLLNARGLYILRQYEKALDAIAQALHYNTGMNRLRLLKYKGLIMGHRGHFTEAVSIFKGLEKETDDRNFLAEIYINIVWANLTNYRVSKDEALLNSAREYLEKNDECFLLLSPSKRKKILNNYSDYYWQKQDYDNAMRMLEKVKEYCEEKDLPEVYNSLAELHLYYDNLDLVREYVTQAEVIATRHGNDFEVGQALYLRGLADLKREDLLKAKDSFYIALTYFCYAQAYSYAFRCFKKILEISQIFNLESIKLLQNSVGTHFKDTPYYAEINLRKEEVR